MEEEKHSLNNYPNPRSKKPWWKDEKAVAIAILSVLVLALVVAIITKDTTDDNNDDPPTPASGKMKAQVMPVQWVKKAIDYKYHSGPKPNNYDEKRDLVIFETQRGNATYLEGHIPHSVHSDADLYENGYPTNFLLPDDKLAENAGSLGVCKKCTTIIYSSNPVYASRLWFILSYIGVEDVRVMNGSFSVWVDEGYPVEETVRNLTSTSFKASFHKNVLLSTSDVEKVFSTNLVQMVDVRSLEEYEGKSSGSSRLLEKGRIPFAAWGSQANAGTYTQPNGILHPPSVILDYWHAGSINTKSVPLYIYCASGYRASLAFMYASMMDVPAAMYSDGWWGWSTNWVRNSSYDEPPTPGWEQQPSGRDVYP
eukprot:TRINITY_DN5701_c3_g1_i1.p1 TRINITY_DN5701_c3_g1~~TRINITY_DN5701_c3_g1_i1.p1  ORF type:complete len:384 (+),score=48.11 TRINITY_DN5701_c3_g1_i1:54-1154(+)